MNGWICLHRKILDWGWFTDANTLKVFLYILLIANYEPKEYLGHIINRGQVVFTRPSAAKKLDMTENQIRTALNHLIKTEEICVKNMGRWSLITIKKYDFYQDIEVPSSPPEAEYALLSQNTNTDRRHIEPTHKSYTRHTDTGQTTTTKQYNKYNKLNNITKRAQGENQTKFLSSYSEYDTELSDFERAILIKRLKRTMDM